MSSKTRVLFVCSGNICRSPLAEAIFRHVVEVEGLADRFEIDSAGMHGYHAGDPADERTRRVARGYGIDVTSIARQVAPADFDRFDFIVAMDRGHHGALVAAAGPERRNKVTLMRDHDPEADGRDVADPYYGDERGFHDVHRVVEAACRGLLRRLR